MTEKIRCSNCGFENPSTARFCSQCGKTITVQCKVCGESVQPDSKFCGKCGVEISSTPAGLMLANALAWKQQFQNLGWWENPDERCVSLIRQLIEQGQIPATDSSYEPWIFVCNGSHAPWKPHLSVETKRGFAWDTDVCFLATRCRLFAFALQQKSSAKSGLRKMLLDISPRMENVTTALWYKDIANLDWNQHGNLFRFCFKSKTSDEIAIGIQVEGTRLIDVVTAFTASDPVVRNWARFGIQVRAGQRLGFIEIIGAFLKEVLEVKELTMQ